MTLCQKCLAEDVIIRRSGYRPVCPGCGASGYLSYLYECGFCGTEKSMNGWCENPSCNSLKKRLIENAYFFLFPVRPYYKGLFRYKFILYPYTLFLGLSLYQRWSSDLFLGSSGCSPWFIFIQASPKELLPKRRRETRNNGKSSAGIE